MDIGAIDRMDIHVSDNSIGIIINDDIIFNDVAFKVLQNQEKYGLIKCGKLSQNGKIKLVYDCGKYKSLSLISNQLKPKEFLTIVSNIHDTVNRILENGFIKMENLLIRDTTIYVDMSDFSVRLICLPLTVLMVDNKEIAKQQLEKVIFAEGNRIQGISIPEVKKILDEGNYVIGNKATVEDEKQEAMDEVVEMEEKKREVEKSSVNVAFVILLGFVTISILIGVAVTVCYEQSAGLVILAVGVLFGIVMYFILPNKHNVEQDTGKVLVLVSTNLCPEVKFYIKNYPYTIGRQHGSVNGVIENEKTVGRIHCKITQIAGMHYIEDMNSVNGTYVNNKKLKQGQKEAINTGDTIRISRFEFLVK